MSTVQQAVNVFGDRRDDAPAQHYSTIVKFIDKVAKGEASGPRTSVDVFESDGKWYCQVRRGDEKTQPMGPYSKPQVERIQDARRRLIAKRGTARLVFQ